MPDITKCNEENNNCPKKLECWRYTSKPSQWQSYADLFKYCDESNDYSYFYPVEN